MATKKVLIYGGCGFIGSATALALKRFHDAEVTAIDSFTAYYPPSRSAMIPGFHERLALLETQGIKVARGCVLDSTFVLDSIEKLKPDAIVHLASMPLPQVAASAPNEAFQSVVTSTQVLAQAIVDSGRRCRLVVASSSMVYGHYCCESVTESHPKNFISIYGAFKWASEEVLRGYAATHGLETVVVRPSGAYGPLDGNARVVTRMLSQAVNGEPIPIHGDGSTLLDLTFIDDLANGIALSATHENAAYQTFNLSRGIARSLNELAGIIQERIPTAKFEYKSANAGTPSRGALCVDHARTQLGYSPVVGLEEGIDRILHRFSRSQEERRLP